MDHGTDCSEILANKVIPLKKFDILFYLGDISAY